MRHRLVALSLFAATALTPVLATATPAQATPTLQVVYTNLPYEICLSFGRSGQENDRWGTWWCSMHYPSNPYYPAYDLWAYVN
ncbi:hypothetical protein [Nonomuraea zeae]|uniref:Secreted protein n=1 Tax=Nonomuraea zeae TaxID=1642303 RepID=A0A5S4H461_9ACTN|nr:hypothetical protein [Nonomuraea zeae]TMR39809.1 hypothetical protein ETD85_00050 [Nonomuraea zeae]